MPFDPEVYAAGLRQANEQERRKIEQRLVEAKEEAAKLIRLLKQDAGCSDAILFGSVATNAVRGLGFDIDIAIWGGDILRAQELVENSPFAIDLVEYERAPRHIQQSIDRFRS